MTDIKVYKYSVYDKVLNISVDSTEYATLNAIEHISNAKPILSTVKMVMLHEIDVDGIFKESKLPRNKTFGL